MKKFLSNNVQWKTQDIKFLGITHLSKMLRVREIYQNVYNGKIISNYYSILHNYTILHISIYFCNKSVTLKVRKTFFFKYHIGKYNLTGQNFIK